MDAFGELRIIRDHVHYRRIKRTRPLTVHAECLHDEQVWKAVKKFVTRKRSAIWYVLTPVNFDFVAAETGCTTSKKEWEKTVVERYKWLKNHGQRIEMHVHLRVKMGLYPSKEEMKKDVRAKIGGAVSWMRKNGFNPKKVVFGWWSFNDYAISVARGFGIEPTGRMDYYFVHDYDFL